MHDDDFDLIPADDAGADDGVGPGAPPPPRKRRWRLALLAAVVAAVVIVAAAVWVVKTDPAAPAGTANPTSAAATTPAFASMGSACEIWVISAPQRATLPTPAAGWTYDTPGIDAQLAKWSAALTPMLVDLEVGNTDPAAPGHDILVRYIAGQRAAAAAAVAHTYTAADAAAVTVYSNALDALCAPASVTPTATTCHGFADGTADGCVRGAAPPAYPPGHGIGRSDPTTTATTAPGSVLGR